MAIQEKTPISMSLAENVARMEVLFDTCADIKKKQMNLGVHKDVPCYLTF